MSLLPLPELVPREGAVFDGQLRHAERVQQRVGEELVLDDAEDRPRLVARRCG